jgi:hypothetical protein
LTPHLSYLFSRKACLHCLPRQLGGTKEPPNQKGPYSGGTFLDDRVAQPGTMELWNLWIYHWILGTWGFDVLRSSSSSLMEGSGFPNVVSQRLAIRVWRLSWTVGTALTRQCRVKSLQHSTKIIISRQRFSHVKRHRGHLPVELTWMSR